MEPQPGPSRKVRRCILDRIAPPGPDGQLFAGPGPLTGLAFGLMTVLRSPWTPWSTSGNPA